MKSRRVLVTIEMTTDATTKELKDKLNWPPIGNFAYEEIHQIQVNVIKKEKEVKK